VAADPPICLLENRLRFNYRGNGVAAKMYEMSKASLNPELVRYVDDLVAQPG